MAGYRYGRRPPKNAPALRLAPLLTGVVPAHPVAQDNMASLRGGWKILGNDSAGDCVAVTWASIRRLLTAVLAGAERYPSQAEVWELYRTQNPEFDPNGDPSVNGPGSPADGGMDIQTVLEYLVKHGGPDGTKALAFAKVDHTNQAEVDAAISIFGFLWTGVVVQAAQQQQFAAGKPWDWVAGSAVDGGHSIMTAGYDASGDADAETWAEEIKLTPGYLRRGVEEMWVVLFPEHLGARAFQEGISLAALSDAYSELTGRPFPVTPPAPAPTPVPPGPFPQPDSADLALVAAVDDWAHVHHAGANAKAARAYLAWKIRKGL